MSDYPLEISFPMNTPDRVIRSVLKQTSSIVDIGITGDSDVNKRAREILEQINKGSIIPEWLQIFHEWIKGGSEDMFIGLYNEFNLKNIDDIIYLLLSEEGFEKLKNTEGTWNQTITRLIVHTSNTDEYNKIKFCDDEKELEELFPNARINLPTREIIKQDGVKAFKWALSFRAWTANWRADAYRQLFIRGVVIKLSI